LLDFTTIIPDSGTITNFFKKNIEHDHNDTFNSIVSASVNCPICGIEIYQNLADVHVNRHFEASSPQVKLAPSPKKNKQSPNLMNYFPNKRKK
jgi:hypothetical protein